MQAQNLKAEELRIKRSEMELRRRSVELDEKKLETALDRERKALELLRPEAAMTPEQRVDEIRGIYGLAAVAR